jgi:hypothetical protein
MKSSGLKKKKKTPKKLASSFRDQSRLSGGGTFKLNPKG